MSTSGNVRKEWILAMLKNAGIKNERNNDFQFWQQDNHPIELNNSEMAMQRLNYIHKNLVESGLVDREEEWVHSSAGEYHGIRNGEIDLIFLD